MSDWYIASARSIQAKMNIADIIEHLDPTTIFIVDRVSSYNYKIGANNVTRIFVAGYCKATGYCTSDGSVINVGDQPTYTIDTSIGPRRPSNPHLTIVNIISVNPDGTFTSVNDISLDKKLPTWVFK